MTMIRPAPSSLAAMTPHSPTAPSPTTATADLGVTSAAMAAHQPVLITSDRASRLGMCLGSGGAGVATSVPSASGTRTASAWQPPTNSRCTHDDG